MLRTLLQALVAVCVALPLALSKVPIPSKYTGSVALVLGIAAGLVVIISALQNAIEARAGVALFRSPTAGTSVPVVVADDPSHDGVPPVQPRGPP